MTLVAILTVRRAAVDQFHRFERIAASVMARYGGAIERTVVVEEEGRGDYFKEVHIVTFPDREAFFAYRSDSELLQASALREASVVNTEVLVGESGPEYRGGEVPGGVE